MTFRARAGKSEICPGQFPYWLHWRWHCAFLPPESLRPSSLWISSSGSGGVSLSGTMRALCRSHHMVTVLEDFIWPSPGGRSQRLCAFLPARRWKAGVTKDYNFALCRFVVIDAPRIASEIALLLCSHDGCSVYWVGIHEHASVSHCLSFSNGYKSSMHPHFETGRGSDPALSQTSESNHDDTEQRILCCAGDCLMG